MSNPRAAGATTTGVGWSHQRRADLRRMSGDLPFKRFVFTAVPALRAYVGRPLSHTMAPQARAVEGLGAEELEDLGPKGPKATSLSRPALAPRPSALDDWEPQSDGSMRNKRSGVRLIVRNPCPPGDIEHEFALAAYNRALSAKPRR